MTTAETILETISKDFTVLIKVTTVSRAISYYVSVHRWNPTKKKALNYVLVAEGRDTSLEGAVKQAAKKLGMIWI